MEQSVTTESENRILIEAVRIAAEQIESLKEELSMTRAQALIRKDLIEKLKSGPGGIMEMKQTIADKENLIDELLRTNWEKSWPTMRKYDTFEEYRDSVLNGI